MMACKKCKRILAGSICHVCKEKGTRNFQGIIVIFDTGSEIAKRLNINEPGRYAIKV